MTNRTKLRRLAQLPRRTAIFLFVLFSGATAFAQTGYTGIFGGGPFYINATNNITEIANSGFTEAIIWNIEVKTNGDLNFNGEFPLVSNGVYIGAQLHPDFAANMALLKQGTIKRVTFSIGSSNVGDWQDVKALVNSQGTGMDSILYKNFAALKAAIPALDALDFDDENSFDSPTTIAFGVMLGQLGYKVNPDAFNNASYWQNVVAQINTQLPGTVDGVHLQAYAGGSGNNPCVGWDFGSVPVWPGLWDLFDTPAQVESIMSGWNNQCGINGGFMWLYDDFVGNGLAAQYAAAINTAVSNSSFTLSAPGTVYINQGSTAQATVTINRAEGFTDDVTLKLSKLPKGVRGSFQGHGDNRKLRLTATSTAATGFTTVTITGTSGDIVETTTFTLAVSSGTGTTGIGTQVFLNGFFNVNAAYTDGTTYTTGGIDGGGYSISSTLLGTTFRIYNGISFILAGANQLNGVACSRQSVGPTTAPYSAIYVLATAVNGSQLTQPFPLHYTDNTVTTATPSISDWAFPQSFNGELEGVAMPYRNFSNGTQDQTPVNLYLYKFDLNPAKTFQAIGFPNNPNVIVFAVTAVP
jgi:hypothetical protein